jgi:hypothetical protein
MDFKIKLGFFFVILILVAFLVDGFTFAAAGTGGAVSGRSSICEPLIADKLMKVTMYPDNPDAKTVSYLTARCTQIGNLAPQGLVTGWQKVKCSINKLGTACAVYDKNVSCGAPRVCVMEESSVAMTDDRDRPYDPSENFWVPKTPCPRLLCQNSANGQAIGIRVEGDPIYIPGSVQDIWAGCTTDNHNVSKHVCGVGRDGYPVINTSSAADDVKNCGSGVCKNSTGSGHGVCALSCRNDQDCHDQEAGNGTCISGICTIV